MLEFWKIGVRSTHQREDSVRIILGNQVAFFEFLMCLTLFLSLILLKPDIAMWAGIGMLIPMVCVFTNYSGYHAFSRFILSVSLPATVFAMHIGLLNQWGASANVLVLTLLAASVLPWALFDIRERIALILTALLNICLLIAQFKMTMNLPVMEVANQSNINILQIIFFVCGLVSVVFFMLLQQYQKGYLRKKIATQSHRIAAQSQAMHNQKIELENTIREVNEAKEEESKRNMINTGLTEFGNLMRQRHHEATLYAEIISKLVQFIGARVGGLYLLDESSEEKVLELKGCYAYDRTKYLQQRISIKEGLLGQCYFEKDLVLLKGIPIEHVKIRSGLGGANPNCLTLIPLLHDNKVEGIIELASFNVFEQHQLDFLMQLGEAIAAFVVSDRTNRTTRMLLEESQQYTEQLRAQEEEMRQNLEEMQASQEQMSRQKLEIENTQQQLINIIDRIPFPVFVKDENSCYLLANEEQARLFNMEPKELIGRSDDYFIRDAEEIEAIKQSDRKVLSTMEPLTLPKQQITFDDGSTHMLQTKKIPLMNVTTQKPNILGISYKVNLM